MFSGRLLFCVIYGILLPFSSTKEKIVPQFFGGFGNYFVSLQRQIVDIMSYTKETLVINNPSEKLLKAIEELRRKKLERLEKLRNMKPEEFNRRVILT